MTVGLGRRKWLVACVFGGGLLPCVIWANPSGGSVAHGKAEFSKPSGKALHITTDKHTIINWEKFSIEAGEYTQFFQPGKDAAVLNRVTGKEASRIFGKLLANGKVYLVNPQGVIVGKEGMINTGGFLASALDISDADFLNGEHMRFHGDSRNGIKNQGTITAASGDLILIGYTVENEGLLEAPEGKVALGAGLDILVKPKEAQKLYIRPEIAQDRAEVGIDNKGVIAALESELQADGNLYSKAVRHSGNIDASKTVTRGGRVFLVADRGETEVSGTIRAPEGEVQILGETVALKTGALIDVSGDQSAGKVFIGGGFRGQDPDLYRSQSTLVEEGVTLRADARLQGDAGQIVAWSDGTTRFYGEASAQGGSAQGDGGLVEVSGLGFLDFNGRVNTLAQNGKTGTLLLDPTNFEFPGTDANFTQSPMGTFIPNSTGNTARIGSSTLTTALGLSNVIIDTTSVAAGSQNGDISTIDNYSYNSPNSFTLKAKGNIKINPGSPLTNSGTGAIILEAQGGIDIVDLTIGSPIVSAVGNITGTAGGNISIQTAFIQSTSGNISFTTNNGANGANGVQDQNGSNGANAGSLTVTGSKITALNGSITLGTGNGGNGGNGGPASGLNADGGTGGKGGNGGNLDISSSILTSSQSITCSSGSGGGGGVGGNALAPGNLFAGDAGAGGIGGDAGFAKIRANSEITSSNGSITFTSGKGGDGGNGGTGANEPPGGAGGLASSLEIISSTLNAQVSIELNSPGADINASQSNLSGAGISLKAGRSVQSNSSIISATGQLLIISDIAAGCNAQGLGIINIQNSTLTGSPIQLFGSVPDAFNLPASTTLNGVQFGNPEFTTKCFSDSGITAPNTTFNAYKKNIATPTTITLPSDLVAEAIIESNQAFASLGKQGSDFAFASPRTLWLLLLALGRRVRRTLARIFNFLRRTTCA